MHKFTKKRIALGALGLLVAVGVAVAYFTTTGSGSGNAEVGKSSNLTIHATVPDTLYPGVPSTVEFEVDNTSAQPQHVRAVHLTGVTAYTNEARTLPLGGIVGCKSEWFVMTTDPVVENQDVPANVETPLTNPGTLEFVNKPGGLEVNQDACKEAFLVASFTSN